MKSKDLKAKNFTIIDEESKPPVSKDPSSSSKTTTQTTILAKISNENDPTADMNGIETAYYHYLNVLLKSNSIKRFDFEPEKLKLAKATYYSPDFRVIKNDNSIEFHETKGFWRDDARVKIKLAAKLHPYVFIAVTRKKGKWIFNTIKS